MQREGIEVTEEMVEAGAYALWADAIELAFGETVEEYLTWSTINREPSQEHRDHARLVLEAVLGG